MGEARRRGKSGHANVQDPRAVLTTEMFAQLPPERDVISYRVGFDVQGRGVVFKCVLRGGGTDVVLLPPATLFHMRDCFRDALVRLNIPDVRRRKGDPRSEEPDIAAWLANQPDMESGDWDGKPGGISRVAIGCEVHAHPDMMGLGFLIDEGKRIYKVMKIPMRICFYLVNIVDDAERDGTIVNLSAATAPSTAKN